MRSPTPRAARARVASGRMLILAGALLVLFGTAQRAFGAAETVSHAKAGELRYATSRCACAKRSWRWFGSPGNWETRAF
jgi:hypothetical protein